MIFLFVSEESMRSVFGNWEDAGHAGHDFTKRTDRGSSPDRNLHSRPHTRATAAFSKPTDEIGSPVSASYSEVQTRASTSRRDWHILPLLSFATIMLMFAAAEFTARILWPQVDLDSCFVNDPIAGYRFRPNCTSRMKSAEGAWTTNHYNECGYRTDAPCGPKPPGALRLVLLGSSVAQGLFAPYQEAFGTKTAHALERLTGRSVQVENLGVFNSSPIYVYRRVPEALKLQPDAVVFLLSPWDLEQKIDPQQLAERNAPNARFSRPGVSVEPGLMKRIQFAVTRSRTVLMAQHFLFQNRGTFLKLYLQYGDKADFLRQPFTPAWQQRFDNLSVIISDMANKFRQAGVPLVVAAVPSRAEAALLSLRTPLPPHLDPFAFGREINRITTASGAKYLDLMTPFSRLAHAESLYYVVDGHLTIEGNALLARELTTTLSQFVSQSGQTHIYSYLPRLSPAQHFPTAFSQTATHHPSPPPRSQHP